MASTENESAVTISNPSVIVNNESVSSKSNLVTKSTILRIVCRVLWIFTLVLLLVAMIVLCTDSITSDDSSDNIHFEDIHAYRYMLSVIIIGIIYTFVRIGFLTYQIMISTKVIKAFILFDFYGDKFISYLLATGTAAGFGVTVDMNSNVSMEEFCSKGFASSTLVLMAFLCTTILSVLSSYALAKSLL